MATLPALLDPTAVWDKMPPDVQRAVGLLAVTTGLGEAGMMESLAHEAARNAGLTGLSGLVIKHLDLDPSQQVPRPDLAVLGVRACRACGCTDAYGCLQGCAWAEETLCTSCVPTPTGRPWLVCDDGGS